MATFYNQATLSYNGGVTNSNVTEGEIVTGLTLTKTALSSDYGQDESISYLVTLTNNSDTDCTDVTITDDLGAYTLPCSAVPLVPLTYIEGSVLYYRGGVLAEAPAVSTEGGLVISGITVPAGSTSIIIYETRANEFAPLSEQSGIYNTVIASGCCVGEEGLSDSARVPTRNEANLTIAKAVCPDVISCGDIVTYTLIIQNTGNIATVATDNVVVRDVFNPTLSDISVTLNGEPLEEGTGYTYDAASGAFETILGAITVPAASYLRDPETCAVTTTPGVAILTVTGTV